MFDLARISSALGQPVTEFLKGLTRSSRLYSMNAAAAPFASLRGYGRIVGIE